MKPTVISSDWLTTSETMQELGISQRTVQKLAKGGHLRFKMAQVEGKRPTRIYSSEDIDRLRESGPPRPIEAPRPITNDLVATRRGASPKAEKQEIRALDMVSIVGNLVAGHKAELEMLTAQFAKSLETVVGMILTNHKAEADANRERLKAEREDNRERWELERQDRLDRRKAARAASTKAQAKPVAAAKARRAHA